MAKAGEREGIIAYSADHVFRLPSFSTGDAAARMKRVEPAEADEVSRRGRRKGLSRLRVAEYEAKALRQRPEFSRPNKRQIHLQRTREEKHPIHPGAGLDVEVMQGAVARIHEFGPVGEGCCQLRGISDPES